MKITAGTPVRKVVVQEVTAMNTTCVVLDRYGTVRLFVFSDMKQDMTFVHDYRHLRRDSTYYLKHIPCKVALIGDNLSVKVVRPYSIVDADSIEHKLYFSVAKQVPPPTADNTGQSGSVESSQVAENEPGMYNQLENSTSHEDLSFSSVQEISGDP